MISYEEFISSCKDFVLKSNEIGDSWQLVQKTVSRGFSESSKEIIYLRKAIHPKTVTCSSSAFAGLASHSLDADLQEPESIEYEGVSLFHYFTRVEDLSTYSL